MRSIVIRSLAIAALIVCTARGVIAQAASTLSNAPQIVLDGMAAYQKSGARAALGVWLKDSPVENAATIEQMIATLAPIEAAYGKMVGSDILRVVGIGTSVRRTYAIIRFERGPLFGYF